jgi:hypothetical protein
MARVVPTYFTSADAAFYPGTVALINSLRLTGNEGEIVVSDLGLTDPQRQRLSAVATVKPPGAPRDHAPKALPTSAEATGCVILLDSDMLIVSRLDDLVEIADAGKLVLFQDAADRWFPEWTEAFELRAPLRRERYANSGFVAFSVDHWPGLLERWAEANSKLPAARAELAGSPFTDVDQDALNALLMSEVAPGSVLMQPTSGMAHPPDLPLVRIDDPDTLQCSDPTLRILHHSLGPKVWTPGGWKRDFRQAYVRLLPRVLCGDDVPIQLRPEELPLWLRRTPSGSLVSRANRGVHAIPGGKRVALAVRDALRAARLLPKGALSM